MSLGTPFTRWADRESGERLVAIAAKHGEDGSILVLPVEAGRVPHPLDWMSERAFHERYEAVA